MHYRQKKFTRSSNNSPWGLIRGGAYLQKLILSWGLVREEGLICKNEFLSGGLFEGRAYSEVGASSSIYGKGIDFLIIGKNSIKNGPNFLLLALFQVKLDAI